MVRNLNIKRVSVIFLKANIITPSETMFNKLQWLSFTKRIQYHTYYNDV